MSAEAAIFERHGECGREKSPLSGGLGGGWL